MPFKPNFSFPPAGDQPQAISQLCKGIIEKKKDQVLLGVTGSGKTYTMAQVIAQTKRPALIMAHNKTLAAQLYHEMKSFFPYDSVEYFVSYYDYYQPEAYIPRTGTYIEKESIINEDIDRMRHAATRALLEKKNTIVVASVSCIYGIGSVETYSSMTIRLFIKQMISPQMLAKQLVELQYKRNNHSFTRGSFRINGDALDIYPVHLSDEAWHISFFDEEIESIYSFDPLTGKRRHILEKITIYPNSHYVVPKPTLEKSIISIKEELKDRLLELEAMGKLLEKQRLEEKTKFDLEMLITTGFCSGIENYSRHLTGRPPKSPPPTLFDYLPKNSLLFIDESHVTIPQINAMYKGDRSRKITLSEYGFRLPSCLDNRPLTFEEWFQLRPQTIYVSATPAIWELTLTNGEVIEQVVRPTGLLDPNCIIRPASTQIDNLLQECHSTVINNERALVTVLTKKMAEDLTSYMLESGLKVKYLHSDIDTLERIEIIRQLRLGTFHILVGINLLREGLDIPECALVAILDADKEGFLRSKTALIQTIGRAARHINGRVILYADHITQALSDALHETNRRRQKQNAYNIKHGIVPSAIQKNIAPKLVFSKDIPDHNLEQPIKNINKLLSNLRKRMKQASDNLAFEEAANLRDQIQELENKIILHQ